MSGQISVTRDGGGATLATVSIDNAGKLNALTVAMWQDLARVMRELSADDALRCIVLRGAGDKAFAAGADIAEFATVRNTLTHYFADRARQHFGFHMGTIERPPAR